MAEGTQTRVIEIENIDNLTGSNTWNASDGVPGDDVPSSWHPSV